MSQIMSMSDVAKLQQSFLFLTQLTVMSWLMTARVVGERKLCEMQWHAMDLFVHPFLNYDFDFE